MYTLGHCCKPSMLSLALEETSLPKRVSLLTQKQTVSQLKARHEGVDSDSARVGHSCGFHK